SLKTGFEIREIRSVRGQGGQPTYTYNNLDDLIADRANRVQVLFGGGKALRNRNYGFYVQDDWRIAARLQLNLGLRYESYPPLRGRSQTTTAAAPTRVSGAGVSDARATRRWRCKLPT